MSPCALGARRATSRPRKARPTAPPSACLRRRSRAHRRLRGCWRYLTRPRRTQSEVSPRDGAGGRAKGREGRYGAPLCTRYREPCGLWEAEAYVHAHTATSRLHVSIRGPRGPQRPKPQAIDPLVPLGRRSSDVSDRPRPGQGQTVYRRDAVPPRAWGGLPAERRRGSWHVHGTAIVVVSALWLRGVAVLKRSLAARRVFSGL